MTVTIRPAAPGDEAALAAVAAATFPLACPPHTTEEAKAAFIRAVLSEDRFAEYLADSGRRLLIAEDADGSAVGYTMVNLGEPADEDVVDRPVRSGGGEGRGHLERGPARTDLGKDGGDRPGPQVQVAEDDRRFTGGGPAEVGEDGAELHRRLAAVVEVAARHRHAPPPGDDDRPQLPGLRGTASALLEHLRARWPEIEPLPVYPAFR